MAYGLTSLKPSEASAERLLTLTRQYWGIENGLHYRRDVTLQEDATRPIVGNAGHIMAIFNNLVIGLVLQHGFRNLAKARRLFNLSTSFSRQRLLSCESRTTPRPVCRARMDDKHARSLGWIFYPDARTPQRPR